MDPMIWNILTNLFMKPKSSYVTEPYIPTTPDESLKIFEEYHGYDNDALKLNAPIVYQRGLAVEQYIRAIHDADYFNKHYVKVYDGKYWLEYKWTPTIQYPKKTKPASYAWLLG